MPKSNKRVGKELREISAKAYQIQLDEELAKLAQDFDDWRNHKIDGFELKDKIHKFHQGPARDLWKFYNYSKPDMLVAYAIVAGHIPESEVSDGAMQALENAIEFYRSDAP